MGVLLRFGERKAGFVGKWGVFFGGEREEGRKVGM